MFGSQATGTADEDSDLDLAVVLRHVRSSWQDAQLMDSLLWQKTRDSGITVSAVVVDELDWNEPRRPLVRSAKAQGRSVA
jgi:predicted nucleotidyltransferase